jgi:hypothetical protein
VTLEQVFFLSPAIATVAIVASLIFVGWQIKDNALQRHQHNNHSAVDGAA